MENKKASHPVWVRGLKLFHPTKITSWGKSHPVWVRGLKLSNLKKRNIICSFVAPRVGAWIETFLRISPSPIKEVAPRVGAWIET